MEIQVYVVIKDGKIMFIHDQFDEAYEWGEEVLGLDFRVETHNAYISSI